MGRWHEFQFHMPLGEYFVVITTSGWFLLEYTSQNNIHVVELLKVTASKLCKRSRTLLNIDLWSKSHIESELLSLKWISRQQLPCDYHLCASVTYVCCVSNKQIWQNYHLSKLSLKCESTVYSKPMTGIMKWTWFLACPDSNTDMSASHGFSVL